MYCKHGTFDATAEIRMNVQRGKAREAADAVLGFAIWRETPEGHHFWNEVHEKLLGYAEGKHTEYTNE